MPSRTPADSNNLIPKLYTYFLSTCAFRMRIILNLKHIPYRKKFVDLANQEQKNSHMFPFRLIPALKIDGQVFNETMAIAQYLEDTRPDPSLLPKNPIDKARVLQICEQVNANIQPLQNLRVKNRLKEHDRLFNTNEWSKYWNEEGFRGLELVLDDYAGDYCFGDSITLADAWVFAQAYNATTRFKVDLKQFPKISEIHDKLLLNEDFVDALPINQEDYVDLTKN